MSTKCPRCGNTNISWVRNYDEHALYICLDCMQGFYLPPRTLFDHITASLEALAEKFVFSRGERCWRRRRCETVFYEVWWSALTGEEYKSKVEALSATIEKLKEAYDG